MSKKNIKKTQTCTNLFQSSIWYVIKSLAFVQYRNQLSYCDAHSYNWFNCGDISSGYI